jgi:2-polyprenyl-3-methyl-5-hydroxy-6-metoxy-1,4-benzoquinol methylase
VVNGKDGMAAAAARPTDEYWDRQVSVAAGDERRRPALERSRLLDQQAERYNRCRPRYPDVVIDALLGPEPSRLEVLDVGCGTGIAARPMAERGAKGDFGFQRGLIVASSAQSGFPA